MEFTILASMVDGDTLNRQFGVVDFERGYNSILELVKGLTDDIKSNKDLDWPNDEIKFNFEVRDVVVIWAGCCWRDLPLDENERRQFYTEMLKMITPESEE